MLPIVSRTTIGQNVASASVTGCESGSLSFGSSADRSGQKAKRILLLEDNALNCELFEEYLDFLGYSAPDTARSLAQFEDYVTEVAAGAYDLVVMDIMLPDGESFPLARRISKASTVPCMAYTARSGSQTELTIREAGFCALLEKPLSIDVLDTALRQVFGPKN